jgi:hypothetical protein
VDEPAVEGRLREKDFGEVLAAIEERLVQAGVRSEWGMGDEGLLFVQSLSTGLAPLAGLDVTAAMASARTFLENFPIYGLPLGDVDQRAAAWLAQLLDTASIRRDYRALFRRLADSWNDQYPRAAGQLRDWSAKPAAPDPRQDELWMRAMVALARTQI